MKNKLNYCLSGDGEKTLVMLHGWGMNKEAFTIYEKQLNTKAKCLIVDFYGFGNSGLPEDYYDTYEYAYQIFLLIKKLKLDKIILVGHSFGGRVSIILSSIFNINLYGLVLTSSAGLNRFSLKRKIKIIKYKIYKKLVLSGFLKKAGLKKFGSDDYKKLSPLMQGCLRRIVNQDLSHLLNKIKVPTKLFWAKDDKDTPLWICNKLKRKIKYSNSYILKSGGHFVYLKKSNKFKSVLESTLL